MINPLVNHKKEERSFSAKNPNDRSISREDSHTSNKKSAINQSFHGKTTSHSKHIIDQLKKVEESVKKKTNLSEGMSKSYRNVYQRASVGHVTLNSRQERSRVGKPEICTPKYDTNLEGSKQESGKKVISSANSNNEALDTGKLCSIRKKLLHSLVKR